MSEKIEEAIYNIFVSQKKTLSLAESCTGGALAARLTQVPGTSQYFLGSVVAYSNAMKRDVLDVNPKTLEEYGAVSQEVVEEMLSGILELTKSDYAVAVSGFAGPEGGTPEKPVGTIWAGIGHSGEAPHLWNLRLSGNRQFIIEQTVDILLKELLRTVKKLQIDD